METTDLDPLAGPMRRAEEVRREPGGDGEQAHQDLESYRIELEVKKEELRRAQAELESLRESEERFQLSVGNLLDAFAIYSTIRDENNEIVDFRVDYVNGVACSLTRRKREDYVGRTVLELYPDLRQTKIFDWYVQAVETGNPVIQEGFAFDTTPHGRPGMRYYDYRIARLGDGFTAAWRDVTERKRAEEMLREREELLRLHVENTPLAVIEWGPDFRLSAWSAGAERMFGWRAEEVIGKRLDEFRWVYDEDVGKVERVSGGLLDGTGLRSISHNRNYRKDGSIIHTEWYNSSVLDEAGNLRSILSLVLDVTEREQAVVALREAQRRTSEILLSITDAFYAVDVAWRLTYVNKKMEALWGRSQEDLVGTALWSLFPKPEETKGYRKHLRAMAERTPVHFETFAPNLHLWADVNIYPTADGGLAVYFRDITERKELEAALAAERESLELRVRERTEALQQANEELRREFAEREKMEAALMRSEKLAAAGRLAAGLAHEIKNPLQAVMGCVQLAQEALPENKEVGTYLGLATQELQRINKLVGQLRDLSRPAQAEECQPICVNEVVERQLALNESRAWEQGIVVEWQPAEGLPPVCDLAGRLQQVVLNLLLNAFDVMPEGGRLQVRSQADEENKGIWLHITDSGPGIPDDVLPHIFEPFYTTREEGQGLGLFICDNIVAEQGGHIEVDSRVGQGTTFSVWLPAAQAR
jgi:PAS domain S-box-containing protein